MVIKNSLKSLVLVLLLLCPKKQRTTFHKTSLILVIRSLFDNRCFSFYSFHQLVGICIVSDSATFIEKIFLYHYEINWLLHATKRDVQKTPIFSNILNFKHNLWNFNNNEVKNNYMIFILMNCTLRRTMKTLIN